MLCSHRHNPISRRDALGQLCAGFGSIALAGLLANEAAAATGGILSAPHFRPRAKRVIFLFMHGGPSQIDTFDYKPLLARDNGKPLPFAKPRVQFAETGNLLASPWKFRQYGESGAWVSDLFPHVAQTVDDLCFVKSLHGSNPAHGGALLKIHTGTDTFIRPSMGSWVSYGLGTENSDLPAYITICPTLGHGGVNNFSSSFLPAWTHGTPIGHAGVPASQAQFEHMHAGMPRDLQRKQLDFLNTLNEQHAQRSGTDQALEGRIESFELAFRMQAAAPAVMDLSGESAATQQLYGIDEKKTENFGRQCLLARRFAGDGAGLLAGDGGCLRGTARAPAGCRPPDAAHPEPVRQPQDRCATHPAGRRLGAAARHDAAGRADRGRAARRAGGSPVDGQPCAQW